MNKANLYKIKTKNNLNQSVSASDEEKDEPKLEKKVTRIKFMSMKSKNISSHTGSESVINLDPVNISSRFLTKFNRSGEDLLDNDSNYIRSKKGKSPFMTIIESNNINIIKRLSNNNLQNNTLKDNVENIISLNVPIISKNNTFNNKEIEFNTKKTEQIVINLDLKEIGEVNEAEDMFTKMESKTSGKVFILPAKKVTKYLSLILYII
jgi:hypothetical protein